MLFSCPFKRLACGWKEGRRRINGLVKVVRKILDATGKGPGPLARNAARAVPSRGDKRVARSRLSPK